MFAVNTASWRARLKARWTKIVPGPRRLHLCALASLALILLFWQWRPLPQTVWNVEGPAALWARALGWFVLLTSTFLINHFDLFGLNRSGPFLSKPAPVSRSTRRLLPYVRHPLYLGFVIGFWRRTRASAT